MGCSVFISCVTLGKLWHLPEAGTVPLALKVGVLAPLRVTVGQGGVLSVTQ